MKFPFFKSLLVAGALLLAWNCSDNTTMSPTNDLLALSEEARMLSTPDGYLYITEDGRVINGQGVEVAQVGEDGTFTYGDNEYQFNPDELEKVELAKTDDGKILVITEDNQVKDTEGNVIGQKNDDGTITNENGDVIADLNGGSDNSDSGEGGENGEGGNNGGSGNGEGHQTSHSSASNGNNNQPGNSAGSNGSNNPSGNSSTSNGNNNKPTSSEVVTHQTLGNITIDGASVQTAQKNSSISKVTISGLSGESDVTRLSWNLYWLDVKYSNGTYSIEGKVPDHFNEGSYSEFFKFDGHDFEFKLTVGSGNNNQNQNPNPNPGTSSSSKQQQTPSSSSKQQQTQSSASQQTTGCPTITYVNGGQSGNGFASRYWDGCKPSCSWTGNTNKLARQCDSRGKTQLTDYNARSVCDGGPAATCISQVPFTVSGCSNMGFAFAAVPSNSPACGRCFELTFTGQGKYETKPNHSKLAGKKLIVMASNIGGDVSGGQFDVLIPGGGVGLYNGTSGYGWGNLGKQYGGLLSDCEDQVGYSGSDDQIYTKRKECLTNKCNSVFSSDSEAKSGCLFLANFMEAAGNPLHTYKEVNCPSVLSSKY